MTKKSSLITCLLYLIHIAVSNHSFSLNVIHYNDFHARFMETGPMGTVCNATDAPCIGGFARLATLVRQAFAREPQSLLLNGGDSFQGSIWFNMFHWNVTQDFMNMLLHDAHVLGNHDFDKGIDGLIPYLKSLDAPVVTSNIIDDDEPNLQGLYEKSIIVERENRKIGIIGVISSITNTISRTGSLNFTNEVEAVKQEAQKLSNQGVNVIIVLSHSGIEADRIIAENAGPNIDLIIGGHSHTLLHNGNVPNISYFIPEGPYPLIVKQKQKRVPIVQAAAYTQYLGEIKLYFDDDGNVLEWEGNTKYIGNEIEQASDVLEKINQYLPIVEERSQKIIGTSSVLLSNNCTCQECNLGDFTCDAFMNAAKGIAHFCIVNQGALRASIVPGDISYETVFLTMPFENNIEIFELKGVDIVDMLEYSLANTASGGARTLQISGMQVWFDGARPVNLRLLNVTIACIDCDIPSYEPLDLDKYYTIVTIAFLGNGGDGYTMISKNRRNVEVIGIDYEIMMDYIRLKSPINTQVDGRLVFTNRCIP